MINLIPDKSFDQKEFWSLIKKHNELLINLRFYAVVMLFASVIVSAFFLHLSAFQNLSILIIGITIFAYNIVLKKILVNYDTAETKINSIHISLLQIILDLFQLSLLIYLTGGVESPLFVFFVFHIILGSILLPVIIITAIACVVSIGYMALIYIEYHKFIPHQQITGLYGFSLYDRGEYILVYLVVFNLLLFISIYLTNKIAAQLFTREAELKNALKKLEDAEKIKQKYVAGIVHELKTPIAAMQSMLDLVLMKYVGPISKDVEEKLLRIKRRAVEAISIINDILKISKLVLLDSIDRTLISITDLIENVIENYSATIEIKKINVLLLDKRKNKINVEGDKTFLELAFSNLIGNAVKYTADEGKIEIIIEDKIGELSVEITDSGIGVPEKDLSSIFNDFYRASNLKKNKIEGTGLGLSVVKQIIDQHNGKISVISPSRLAHGENRGATFKITLPL